MKIAELARTSALVAAESFKSFQVNKDLQKAATAAYYSFLAMIPLGLLVLGIAGRLVASSETAMAGLEGVAGRLSPVAAPVVLREVAALARQRTWGAVSLLVFFWSVTPLAAALRSAFGDMFRSRAARPFWSAKLRDVSSVLVLAALLVLLTLDRAYGAALGAWFARLPGPLPAAHAGVLLALALAALVSIYSLLVPVRLRWGSLLIGAVVALLLLALVGPAFALLLRINPAYGYVFGSLKMVFLLFIWIYYSFAALLFGTEVMANVWRRDALVLRRLLTAPPAALKPGALLNRHVRRYPQGAVICREGEPGDAMFFILSGEVALSREGRPLRTLPAGAYFGELAMLIETPRTATAVAAAPEAVLAVIARANFEIVLGENPPIMLAMLRELAARLKETTTAAGAGPRRACGGRPAEVPLT